MSPPISPGGTNQQGYNPNWSGQQTYPAAGYPQNQATAGVQTTETQANVNARRSNANASNAEPMAVDFTNFLTVEDAAQIAPAAGASQSSYAGNNQNAEFGWASGSQSNSERRKGR